MIYMTRQFGIFLGVIIIGIIVVAVMLYRNYSGTATVIVNGKTFTVEVANTDALRTKGLSGHAPLADNGGMLFVFPTAGNYGFWMKDMLYPLDIIWVNTQHQVVHIEQNLGPGSYPTVYYPGAASLYVLEVNDGQVSLLNLQVGDIVQFKTQNL